MKQLTANKIGRLAAVLAAIFALTYSVFAILSLLKLLPHSSELFWQFLPSLLLAFAFATTVVCLHYTVAEEKKIYTALASSFAVVYCTCVTIVYFTQLAVVIPQLLQHKIDDNHLLAFTGNSFMVAVDCIGYGVMCLSAFCGFCF
jgi:glucan phosphoethanolaminetransferase (alkaline phosphatase superfamily)